MMRRIAVLLTLLLAGATQGRAEVPRFGNVVQAVEGQEAIRRAIVAEAQPLRIQVSYQLQEAADRTASLDAQRETVLSAHARLYGMIEQECAVISRAFGGTCHIASLNIGNGNQSYGPLPITTYTASAVFEVAMPASPPVQAR